MEIERAVTALSALAQESRLGIFRLLIEQGRKGMSAGDIALRLGGMPNTVSTHLGILTRSGLIQSHRLGRSIIYSVDLEGIQELLMYLIQDCCKGQPELCQSVFKAALKNNFAGKGSKARQCLS